VLATLLVAGTLDLTVFCTGFMPAFKSFRGEILFLFRAKGGIFFLGVVAILYGFGLQLPTARLELRYVDRAVRFTFRRLPNVILVKGHTGIKVNPQLLVTHYASLNSIEFFRFDARCPVGNVPWTSGRYPCIRAPPGPP
jgi:hypothetical protein